MAALVVAFYLLLVLAVILLSAIGLQLGLKLAKGPPLPKFRRTVAVVLLLCVLEALLLWAIHGTSLGSRISPRLLLVLQPVLLIAIAIGVLMRTYHLKLMRAVVAWLAMGAMGVVSLVLTQQFFIPFVVESFRMSGMAMAPTLLPEHLKQDCPRCGEPAYAKSSQNGLPIERFPEEESLFCERFHLTESVDLPGETLPADSVFIAKFLKPKRWDMIVYRPVWQPESTFIHRIVGMPGEVITIHDGAVWADGQRLEVPAELKDLPYLPANDPRGPSWGRQDNPAPLGDDQYFVLGDFPERSNDSRHWRAVDGEHAPYAVPTSSIQGVVTQIYWPPSRWRAFR